MNTKKQYMAPASEVVDVEVQLLTSMSIEGETSPKWTEDTVGNNDDFI